MTPPKKSPQSKECRCCENAVPEKHCSHCPLWPERSVSELLDAGRPLVGKDVNVEEVKSWLAPENHGQPPIPSTCTCAPAYEGGTFSLAKTINPNCPIHGKKNNTTEPPSTSQDDLEDVGDILYQFSVYVRHHEKTGFGGKGIDHEVAGKLIKAREVAAKNEVFMLAEKAQISLLKESKAREHASRLPYIKFIASDVSRLAGFAQAITGTPSLPVTDEYRTALAKLADEVAEKSNNLLEELTEPKE